MGSKCSCLTSSTQDKNDNNERSPLETPPHRDISIDEGIGDPKLREEAQINLQSLARGYLLSKPLLSNRSISRSSGEPTASNKEYSKTHAKKYISKSLLKKESSRLADEMLGELSMKIPSKDEKKMRKKRSLRLKDGTVYEGECNKRLKKHGRGVEKRPDGTKLTGYYKKGFLEGMGRALFKDGSIYQGNFQKSKPSGTGVFIDSTQAKYTGEFKEGGFIEKGTKEFPDGSVYEGNFSGMEMHGKGKITWKNQDSYEGNFEQGKMHGKGVYKWSDGNVYQGEFSNGEIKGRGTIKYTNGDVYEGGVENGKAQGRGMLRTAHGEVHKCFWVDGLQQGNGTISYRDQNAKVHLMKVVWDHGKRVEDGKTWQSK